MITYMTFNFHSSNYFFYRIILLQLTLLIFIVKIILCNKMKDTFLMDSLILHIKKKISAIFSTNLIIIFFFFFFPEI
jgi:hypothetical protein